MKVCILSMQRVGNMGSLLQSYALKTTIERLGHQVEFIDIEKREDDYKLLGDYKQKYDKEKETTGLIGKIKKTDRYTLNRLRIKKKSIDQENVFEQFRQKELFIDRRSSKYDVCVIGSDEVFNCLNSGAWGFTSQLFGNVSNADKVITYAASCGSTKYQELPQSVADKIRSSFDRVSAFSVRDNNTHRFVEKLTPKTVVDSLDPVLIYNFDKEVEAAILPELPAHYCVVYSYYNRIHTKKEIEAIETFCKEHNLTPVAIGAPQFWVKNYVVCDPFQCLKIFQQADFVITDTFHGTIFSAKYAKRFAVLARDSNKNKLLDLVDKICMKAHLMDSIEELDAKYGIAKNKAEFNDCIKKEQEKSLQYLQNNI